MNIPLYYTYLYNISTAFFGLNKIHVPQYRYSLISDHLPRDENCHRQSKQQILRFMYSPYPELEIDRIIYYH